MSEQVRSASVSPPDGSGGIHPAEPQGGTSINYAEWESYIKSIAFNARQRNRNNLALAYEKLGESEDRWWMRQAIRCVHYLSKTHHEIAADDIWDSMANFSAPNNPRSMGVVFKICKKAGIIEPTEKFRKTRRKKANGREIRIWRPVQ